MGIIKKVINRKNYLEEYGIYIALIQNIYKLMYRRRINGRVVQFLSEERLMKYLDKYSYIWEKRQPMVSEKLDIQDDNIWTMWLQGESEAPLLIRRCIDSIKDNSLGRRVIILDEDNIEKYIDIPKYIKEKYLLGYITKTHYSDLVRMMILKKYGGCWLDSTVFISHDVESNQLSIKEVLDQDFFMIKAPLTLNQCRISSSWIIRAQKNNPIINVVCDLLLEYWKNEKYIRAYFLIHICFAKVVLEDNELRQLWEKIPYYDDSPSNYLRTQFSKTYDENEWKKIKKMTSIHKLNWKLCQEGGENFGGKGSFCQMFLDELLK